MTNLSSVDSEELFQFYRERGNAENFIKERKAGFFGDKTDSSTMIKNEIRMMMGCTDFLAKRNLLIFRQTRNLQEPLELFTSIYSIY